MGRIVAGHLGKHLPGQPAVEVETVGGARGLRLGRQLAETEPRDGSVIGLLNLGTIQGYVIDPSAYEFKPEGYNWVGSLAKTVTFCVKKALSDVTLTDTELSLGASTKTATFYANAAIVRHLFNKDANIIVGFDGENELMAALDRGEIDVYCGPTYSTYKREGREATQTIIGGAGSAERLSELGVEDLFASATGLDQQAIKLATSSTALFYSLALPPGTDPETVRVYRDAFNRMNEDPDFLEEIKARVAEYAPATGEEVQTFVDGLLATDPAVVARAAQILK